MAAHGIRYLGSCRIFSIHRSSDWVTVQPKPAATCAIHQELWCKENLQQEQALKGLGVSQNKGHFLGVPIIHEDYGILGSVLGSTCLLLPVFLQGFVY